MTPYALIQKGKSIINNMDPESRAALKKIDDRCRYIYSVLKTNSKPIGEDHGVWRYNAGSLFGEEGYYEFVDSIDSVYDSIESIYFKNNRIYNEIFGNAINHDKSALIKNSICLRYNTAVKESSDPDWLFIPELIVAFIYEEQYYQMKKIIKPLTTKSGYLAGGVNIHENYFNLLFALSCIVLYHSMQFPTALEEEQITSEKERINSRIEYLEYQLKNSKKDYAWCDEHAQHLQKNIKSPKISDLFYIPSTKRALYNTQLKMEELSEIIDRLEGDIAQKENEIKRLDERYQKLPNIHYNEISCYAIDRDLLSFFPSLIPAEYQNPEALKFLIQAVQEERFSTWGEAVNAMTLHSDLMEISRCIKENTQAVIWKTQEISARINTLDQAVKNAKDIAERSYMASIDANKKAEKAQRDARYARIISAVYY